ncbi:MAG: chemotaxis protein CheW [Melioribacteraceae bacterium]|nr:chemotaxis protein CheW [Melioribacteraceae bacterium]
MNIDVENTIKDKDLIQLVTFCLGEEEFGFDIFKVKEINKMMELASVPNSPSFVEGVANLRGRIIPVLDLRNKLGMKKKNYDDDTRIIVIEIHTQTVGFIVDRVNEVLRISQNITEPPPEIVTSIESEFITAIAKLENRLLILLDLEKVLTKEEINTATKTINKV